MLYFIIDKYLHRKEGNIMDIKTAGVNYNFTYQPQTIKSKTQDNKFFTIQEKVSLGGGHLPVGSFLTSMPLLKDSGGRTIIPDTTQNIEKKDTSENKPKISGNITTLSMFEGEGVVARTTNYSTGINDQYLLNDGFDTSRDITSVTSHEGKPSEPYSFTVKFNDLQPGAEVGNLDLYLLLSLGQGGKINLPDDIPGMTEQPWNISLGAYDTNNFNVYDENGILDKSVLKNLKFDSLRDTVSFSIDKSVMRKKGWKDGEHITFQTFTAKDFVKKVVDSLDDPVRKPWNNNGNLSNFISSDLNYMSSPSPSQSPSASITGAAGSAADEEIDDRSASGWATFNDPIYFAITDRFYDGDVSNNFDVNKKDLTKFHGGDLQGIIDKLDYIKDLGMGTVWVTPTMANQDLFMDSAGYHGYWPVDFFKVDKHLGDMDKFKELVAKAHEKGMKIVLDIPLNHIAWEHPWKSDPTKQNWLHHNGDVQNWNDPWQVENCSMYGLPDLAQENPEVSKALIDMAKFWIDQTGIDGFRLDAIKHVPMSFWSQFSKEIHGHAGKEFLLIGECFDGNPEKLNSYQKNDMNSLFDMPLFFTETHVFGHDGSMRDLANQVAHLNRTYQNPEMMSAIIDNHDTKRFLTEAGGDKNKLKLALSFIMTVNRIPTIYYGTEVGMDGDVEQLGVRGPENRRDMEWDKDPDMLNYFKQISSIRNNNVALTKGAMMEMWQDDRIYSYSRMHPDQEAIVVLNNAYDTQQRDIPLRAESKIKDGTVLKDLMSGEKVTVRGGKIHIQPGGKKAQIFVVDK